MQAILNERRDRSVKPGTEAVNDLPYIPRPGLRPLRQGAFDGLCGIYAIINAVRWAAWPEVINDEVAASLFADLTKQAIGRMKLKEMVARGATTERLNHLSQHAIRFLREKHGMTYRCEIIDAKRMHFDADKTQPGKIMPTARQGEAFILDIDYDHGHWTVLAKIDGGKAYFFDSAGHRPFRLDRFTLCGAVRVWRA